VTGLLAPYYLCALEPAENDAVDRHLRDCAECRMSAREVCDVVAALALIDDDTELGSPRVRPARSTRKRVRAGAGPVRPAGPVAPAGRHRGRRRRIALTWAALALAVLLFAGFGTLSVVDWTTDEGPPGLVTVAVTGGRPGTGVSASVFASETDLGTQLRVTATGLRTGITYQLFVVTSAGRTHEVSRWTSRPVVQEISGLVPGRLADLAFVTISVVNGPPVVTVELHRPGTGPSPR